MFILVIILFSVPSELLAFRNQYIPVSDVTGRLTPAQPHAPQIRSRLKMPIKLPVDEWDPGRQVRKRHRGHKPMKSTHDRHDRHRYRWSTTTTIVREIQPIVILNNPPPAEPIPAPEPQKVWVPPIMDTRTEPGYWDYGIKKVWMGDHWRYEQNVEERIWVPESQVAYVKQEGYWKFIE